MTSQSPQVSSDIVLALDLGMHMGFAVGQAGKVIHSDHVHLEVKKASTRNMRWLKLTRELGRWHDEHALDVVVYEQPGNLKGHARKVIPGIQAVVELWCVQNGVDCETRSPSHVKMHATGKGNSTKDEMERLARQRWPHIEFKRHDQIDAVWLLDAYFSVR